MREFDAQLVEALDIADKGVLTPGAGQFSNVIICGMGGSGIGGNIVADLVSNEAKTPISINRNYILPEYVNDKSLVIISSYSGNTEETLEALRFAIEKKAKVVCITSGGKVLEIAKGQKIDHIIAPATFPPRVAIGYSIIAILKILNFNKVIPSNHRKEVENTIQLLNNEEGDIQSLARKIAAKVAGKLPAIYTSPSMSALATRFAQDLNENSKMLAHTGIIPEMNHNEILGWKNKNENIIGVFLRSNLEHPQISKRIELTKEIIKEKSGGIIEIKAKGNSSLEQAFYLIYLGGWVSLHIAEIKNIDPVETKIIDEFKVKLCEN